MIGIVLSSVLIGLAVAGLTASFVRIMHHSLDDLHRANDFDSSRRRTVARKDQWYRYVRPLVNELAHWPWLLKVTHVDRVDQHLKTGAEPVPWKAKEYIAVKTMDTGLAALVLAVGASYYWDLLTGIVCGIGWFLLGLTRIESELGARANARKQQIDRRLPYAIDLMALMMSAGATAYESIAVMVQESQGHPLGDEFRRIHQSIERGASLEDALLELRERLQTDAVNELAVVVKLGVAQGTPLSESFLGLADQVRLRRSQWAEKAAGKAQTMITFPAMVVMAACLVIIVAPFAVTALS